MSGSVDDNIIEPMIHDVEDEDNDQENNEQYQDNEQDINELEQENIEHNVV